MIGLLTEFHIVSGARNFILCSWWLHRRWSYSYSCLTSKVKSKQARFTFQTSIKYVISVVHANHRPHKEHARSLLSELIYNECGRFRTTGQHKEQARPPIFKTNMWWVWSIWYHRQIKNKRGKYTLDKYSNQSGPSSSTAHTSGQKSTEVLHTLNLRSCFSAAMAVPPPNEWPTIAVRGMFGHH